MLGPNLDTGITTEADGVVGATQKRGELVEYRVENLGDFADHCRHGLVGGASLER